MKQSFFPAVLALACLLSGCGSGTSPVTNMPSASLSATTFSFGNDVVGHALTSVVVTVLNPGTQALPAHAVAVR